MNYAAVLAAVDTSLEFGARVLMRSLAPLQPLVADSTCATHDLCNQSAIEILEADDHRGAAELAAPYLSVLNDGSRWADAEWRNRGHYFDPTTGRGLWRFPDAASLAESYWERALEAWRHGRARAAMFALGAALHVAQDLCVPHHAALRIWNGHREYEDWVRERRHAFVVSSGGLYRPGFGLADWVIANARASLPLLTAVDSGSTEQSRREATAILLGRAQRCTAGMLLRFWEVTGGRPSCAR